MGIKMKIKFILGLVVLCLSACVQANIIGSNVVLIGDEMRNQVLADCLKSHICPTNTISPPKNADAVVTAQFSNQAKQAVLVVDSKSGPLPIIREHILIARQTQVPKLAVLFADSELIDDKELMSMEVEEIQALIDTYDMRDRFTEIYYGKKGLKALMQDTQKVPTIKKADTPIKTQRIKADVYNLTKEEMGVKLKNGSYVKVWISGQIRQAKINAKQDIEQGDNAEFELVFENPIYTNLAERLFIQVDNRIVSAGYVLAINQKPTSK